MRFNEILNSIEEPHKKKAKKISEEIISAISKNDKHRLKEIENEIYEYAINMDSLEESIDFVYLIEKETNQEILKEGFGDFVKKVGQGIKNVVKSVIQKIKDFWSGPYVAAIKKWNLKMNKIIDQYEGINESLKLYENEDKEEEKSDDEIKDDKAYWILLIKKSNVMDNSDGFYDRLNVNPKMWIQGNFAKWLKKNQYDLFTILRKSNHKVISYKPMNDAEVMAYLANVEQLLLTMKVKKLIPPEFKDEQQQFITKFLRKALKVTQEFSDVVNRDTVIPPNNNQTNTQTSQQEPTRKGALNPQDVDKDIEAKVELSDEEKLKIKKFKEEYPTFVDKLSKTMSEDSFLKLIDAIEKYDVKPESIDDIVSFTDFLENGINIDEKMKYIKTLQAKNFNNKQIMEIIKYIIDNKMEETFSKNEVLMDVDNLKKVLEKEGTIMSIDEEIFNKSLL